jgi:5-methylcytosine-specific restriction endonuclease McrA
MLTPWMAPHRVISWQRAVTLVFLGKVEVLAEYDEEIRAPAVSLKTPAVVRLTKGVVPTKNPKARFTRVNVFTRDGFRCQYCGARRAMADLNYDHVVPRVRGGRTSWENIVTSCYPCNGRKGSRTPEQAGMKLLRKPFKPTSLPFAPAHRLEPTLRPEGEIPHPWRDFCGVHDGAGA